MSVRTIRARWVVPVGSPPIEGGRVRVEDGRILAVEHGSTAQRADIDHGDAILLPGFVNAHTHLELTAFRGGAPYPGSFTDWLRAVVSLQTADDASQRMDAGIESGLHESLAAGVTTIADIGCGDRAVSAWTRTPANIVGFFEAIGMGPRRHDDHPRSLRRALAACEEGPSASGVDGSLAAAKRPHRLCTFSISPHAPYSTAPEVYRDAIVYCRERRLPICTHLAETREETEFLARGTGPFRALLEERGLWDGSFTVPGCSPVAYAEALGLLACRPLLAHGNYLGDTDITLLARHDCSVAYCPRTHRFFEHAPHRYRELRAAGVNVCIGTDSEASTPSLSILDELRFLRSVDTETSDAHLLEMATRNGARGLGLESELGSIEAAKRADLIAVPLADPHARDPVADLLRSRTEPAAVYVGGRSI